MPHTERARHFATLHVAGRPLVIYNAWDSGSAAAIAEAGALAIGTSSWAIAAAHGYADGEAIPLPFVEQVIARIVQASALPVTVDVEGGYSDDPRTCAAHVGRFLDLGVAGINFEDRVVGGTGLHGVAAQCARIAAIRALAEARGVPLFINARTDLFFVPGAEPATALEQARLRAAAYAEAGASGLFVPGLVDPAAIADLCGATRLPVNVMVAPDLPDAAVLARAGVARISHGPAPWLQAMAATRAGAQAALRAVLPA